MERKKPGPPPRWDHSTVKQVKVRMPGPLAAAFQDAVRQRGLTVQDFIGRLAEEMTGVPYDPQDQEELPLELKPTG